LKRRPIRRRRKASPPAARRAKPPPSTARLRAVERARRGLSGTIATSARGVLDPLPAALQRKTLLGE
jgi:hypothetical protein